MAALVLMSLLFIIMDTAETISNPQIKVRPAIVVKGKSMTVTCEAEPRRATTELQFAFYRNGHNVQGFSSSNQYGVPSAQLEHSGSYICEVQTQSGRRRKRSNVINIQIQDDHLEEDIMMDSEQYETSKGENQSQTLENTLRLVLSAVIFIIILCIIFYHKRTMDIGIITDPQAPLQTKPIGPLPLPPTLHQHFASAAPQNPHNLAPRP
ncbi:uncharacterized protein LOC121397653 [Xenopus laevis]|uniref:Uncharacterized protein LOC121397653 n=1 Tax=Xenopus laevis TaxID=8355 RepID=A0A8J1LN83_XENLA|nr:uncharacterized protein LOC121397653 [Xenopus laevis]